MRKILFIATTVLSMAITATAQVEKDSFEEATGMHFEQQLQWSEILTKAKAEHKYIFVDCYATWCGPCKQMEQAVYPLKAVAEVYNKDFISLKVQMDQTSSDDSLTKSRYDRAKMFAETYHVDAYPTFLFFDPDGKPVHKVTGAIGVKPFIQLAADAQSPDKQYYAILKNFEPGKLDTSELKGLALSFHFSDEALANKLALDFLTRVSKERLGSKDNLLLMYGFHENAAISSIAVKYISNLKKAELTNQDKLDFIAAFGNHPEVKQIVVNYIRQLPAKGIGDDRNLRLMMAFQESLAIRQIAKVFINQLPERGMDNQTRLEFIKVFTYTPQDKGFKFFYDHTEQIDVLMKDTDWAQSATANIIENAEFRPLLETAKKVGKIPDFDAISNAITQKYSAYYAERIILNGKIEWFNYLVNDKKEERYRFELTQANIDNVKRFWKDRVLTSLHAGDINNTCNDIFHHSKDAPTINLAVDWMKKVTTIYPADADELDTYACVLYKAGKIDEALKIEERILQVCIDNRVRGTYSMMKRVTLSIQKMWTGEKIWQEKEFQN